MTRRRNSDWDDLPSMFALPQAFAPGVLVDLSVEPGVDAARNESNLARALQDLLSTTAVEVSGGRLRIRRGEEPYVHQAVLDVVSDPARDNDLRSGALDLVKRIEAATGIHPQQGLFEIARSTGVMWDLIAQARREGLRSPLAVRPAGDQRRTLRLVTGGADRRMIGATIEMFPSVVPQAFAQAYERYHDLNDRHATDDPRDSENIEYEALTAGMRAGLEEFRDLLSKTGVETAISDVCGYGDPLHFVVCWWDPATQEAALVKVWEGVFEDPSATANLVAGVDLPPRDWHLVSLGDFSPDEWRELAETGALPHHFWDQ